MRRWGNLTLRSKALKILEDVESTGNVAKLKAIMDMHKYKYYEFTPDKNNKTANLLGAVDHNNKRIFVNEWMPLKERHFILAHEIGHVILHPDDNHADFRRHPPINDDIESEANVLAYELVMPFDKFIKLFKKYKGDVSILSDKFLVPEKNVRQRIKFLKKQVESGRVDEFE